MWLILLKFIFGDSKKNVSFSKEQAGAFPDVNSALMLVAARLRHIGGTRWGTRRSLNIDLLKELKKEEFAA